MDLYDELASTAHGRRDLASARLRECALEMLDQAMAHAGVNQAELARRLGRRRHAINQIVHGDGNFKLSTLAEYLAVLGCEIDLELFDVGELRSAEIDGRTPVNVSEAPARKANRRRTIVYRHVDDPAEVRDDGQRAVGEHSDGSIAMNQGSDDSVVFPVTVRRGPQHA